MYQGKYVKKDTDKTPVSIANDNEPVGTPVSDKPQVHHQPVRRKKKKSRRFKVGTIVFYSIYAVCVIAIFIGLLSVLDPLREWLIKYEASQPNYKRDEVFSQLFADPDWETIYDLAGIQDTTFENSKSFAACMQKLVGDTELTCLETSAGLSGDKKFIVKLGEQKIASFTLTGGATSQTEIPEWNLGTVEVFFKRTQNATILRYPGQSVYVNGVALDDSYVVRTTSTVAENYLPEGIHGYRTELLYISDLMVVPEITIKNSDGTDVSVMQDPQTGIFAPETAAAAQPTENEKLLALNATQTYAKYMIGKATLADIQKLFDTNSQFYTTIRSSELGWVQSGASYDFSAPVYSDFYRYSDTLFSIKLDMALNQTRFDGSVKVYTLNNTLFFQKNDNGNWLVMEATNISVQEQTSQVKIAFVDNDQILRSEMVNSDISTLTLPSVTAPEGKVFSGWVKQDIDTTGKITLTIVFEPTADNTVYLPSESTLEPMTLYALYEEAKSE